MVLYIVLGMLIADPVARSAAAQQRLLCELSAWYNLMPRVVTPDQPDTEPIFYVAGRCVFPTPGFSVELKSHTPPSLNPKILLLDAIVHAPAKPVPHVPTDVTVRYGLLKTSTVYEKVIILPDNLSLTVEKTY
jgi:hypothetical protein